MRTEAQKLFDRILCLKEKESIKISFKTQQELNSLKTLLYRERNKFNRDVDIYIKQVINKEKKQFNLYIGKSQTIEYEVIKED